MMMLSSCFFVLIMMAGNGMVMADRMIRFTFNDGITPMPGDECTVADNKWIDPLFNISAYVRSRRQLIEPLEDGTVDLNHPNYQHHRELSATCKDNCAGIARGTCRATGCLGYRRRERNLQASPNATCVGQISAIHWALDQLIYWNKVTEPCRRYLTKTKRKTECYDNIIYGEILSFTFYNMRVGVLQYNVANGYTICSNIALNVEAVLNPCVKMVNFTMTGPNNLKYNRIDDNHPMLLFNTTTHASTYGGRYLSPGAYQMSARPDNFVFKEKKLDFNVIQCGGGGD